MASPSPPPFPVAALRRDQMGMMMLTNDQFLAAAMLAMAVMAVPAQADPTPECNDGAFLLSTECGSNSSVGAANASAIGANTVAGQPGATALGTGAQATGIAGSALGHNTRAGGLGALAAGVAAQATANNSVALGRLSQATADGAIALGATAQATFANSVAVGFGAATTATNQVSLGGTGSAVRVGDIAASTAAQSGPAQLMTIDASGTIGRSAAPLTAIGSLTDQTGQLFDITRRQGQSIRELNEGVAMAMAMDVPMLPQGASFAVSANIGYFADRMAGTAAFTARLADMTSLSAGAGIGFATGEVGARAGIQHAW